MSAAILTGEGVTRRFGGLTAVSDVSFGVREGEIFGLIGPNGAGKTTLFSLVVGALRPTAGTLRFRGQRIDGLAPHAVCRRGICRTHQIVKPFREMTVFENVLVGASFGSARTKSSRSAGSGLPGAAALAEALSGLRGATEERPGGIPDPRARAAAVLRYCGLDGRVDSAARTLTIGELKRLEIARSLATDPELLLLDEVMGGLNPAEIETTMNLIRRIRRSGITVLLIEHHMKAVMGVSDRVMVLHHGEKIAEGTPAEIVADRRVIEAYLGDRPA